MTDLEVRIAQTIAQEINARPEQARAAIALLDEGATRRSPRATRRSSRSSSS